MRKQILNIILLILGVLFAGFGLEGFLIPNHFIDGGITGISMLLAQLTHVSIAVWLVVINVPFLIAGYFYLPGRLVAKGAIAILALALCVVFLPYPLMTHDKLLAAVFGGFFVGAGIGLAIRGGGVLDGTEILAILVDKRWGISVGDVILILNIAIFSIAAFVLGIEPALYSILTYLAASKTVDFLIYGIEGYFAVMIISEDSNRIKRTILDDMNIGVTILKASGGYKEVDRDILFCVVTRLELPGIKQVIKGLDGNAVIFVSPITDASGGVIRSRSVY